MKTLILSSSFSSHSHSYELCRTVETELSRLPDTQIRFVDLRRFELLPCHKGTTEDMERLASWCAEADNFILGMGVHCYTVNDGLKMFLDTCFKEVTGKFFGIVCAAGGDRSYLSTMHLTQICMNEWRMIQLPRVLYASSGDFHEHRIANAEILRRATVFAAEFHDIGQRLVR
jgi:NAD(P)H-dependent FMN reductase